MTDTRYCQYCDKHHPATDQFYWRQPNGDLRVVCKIECRRRKNEAERLKRHAANKPDPLLKLAQSARWV